MPDDVCKVAVYSPIVKLPAASFPTDSLVLGPTRHPPSLSIGDQRPLSERVSKWLGNYWQTASKGGRIQWVPRPFLLAFADGKACPDWAPERMRDHLYDMYLPRDDLVALGERSCLSPAICCHTW